MVMCFYYQEIVILELRQLIRIANQRPTSSLAYFLSIYQQVFNVKTKFCNAALSPNNLR